VLQHQASAAVGGGSVLGSVDPAVRAHASGPLATAFGHTFAWAAALAVAAVVPAAALALTERSR
jgi:hypothetical protein